MSKQAQASLGQGKTAKAEAVFKQVLTKGKKASAEAAYQLGQLASNRIDYTAAYQYFLEAAKLQPDNPLFLNAAGWIAHTLEKYSEAESYYLRSLKISEKALGPDHPLTIQVRKNLLALKQELRKP